MESSSIDDTQISSLEGKITCESKTSTTSTGNLLISGSDGLDIPSFSTLSESKTWWFPTPYVIKSDTGIPLITLDNMRFTKIRANIPQGGYMCYMTLASEWTTGNWGTRGNDPTTLLHILLELRNSEGGLLYPWHLRNNIVRCRLFLETITFMQQFSPDLYDVIDSPYFIHEKCNYRPC